MDNLSPSPSAFWQTVRANHTLQHQEYPISIAPRDGQPLPLVPGQERLWRIDQMHLGNTAHNLRSVLRLQGRLNVEALVQSVQDIVQRHEILRTSFPANHGHPVQRIHPTLNIPLPVVDLGAMAASEQEHAIQRWARDEAQTPFDLATLPLLRLRLLRLAEDDHILIRTTHHIISDRWSDSVFLRELVALYSARVADKPAPLPALPLQFADIAWSQHEWLQGDAWTTQVAYWQEQLAGSLTPLVLPTSDVLPTASDYHGGTRYITIDATLTAELKTLGQQAGVSLFAILLAALQTLLHRHSGQEDMLICVPIAGRNRVDTRKLIGYFNNLVLIRSTLEGNLHFRALAQQVGATLAGAVAHQTLPLQHLVDMLHLPSNILSRAMFTLQNVPDPPTHMGDIQLTPLDMEEGISNFDLSLSMKPREGQLIGVLRYKTSLFTEATITHMLEHFTRILAQLAANPDQRLTAFPPFQPQPAPTCTAPDTGTRPGYVAPETALEQTITRIWQHVLRISPIGVHDNFFALGGRSLAMMNVCSELQALLPDIAVVELSRHSTVRAMAQYLEQNQRNEHLDTQSLHDLTQRQKRALKRRQELAKRRNSKGEDHA